jgi:hypothetical protein
MFWCGENAAEIIARVPVPAEAGRLIAAACNINGPSGIALDELYLRPLGVTRNSAWLCDLLPESRQNKDQANAVARMYAPLAKKLGLPTASVPMVPNRLADDKRVKDIVDEFLSSGANTLVTLGDKPLKEFVRRLHLMGKTSISAFGRTETEYGQLHPFTLGGRKFELLPLVHPRQAAGLGGNNASLRTIHASWVARKMGG